MANTKKKITLNQEHTLRRCRWAWPIRHYSFLYLWLQGFC